MGTEPMVNDVMYTGEELNNITDICATNS